MKARKETWRKKSTWIAAGLALSVLSLDGFALVNYSNHPDLAKAMQFDPAFNGVDGAKADRAQAERYYLKYLQDVNDSFQQARVYAQLGALYAVAFNRQKGEEPNDAKARAYYEKVLELEPKRMGPPTMWARSMLCCLRHPMGMERIKARMEFYAWLNSWNEAKIKELWLPSRKPGSNASAVPAWVNDANEAFAAGVRVMLAEEKEPTEGDIRGTLNALADYREVAVLNAATDAMHLKMPGEGFKYIREHLPPDAPERKALEEIIRSSTRSVIDEAAQEVLNSLVSVPRPPTEETGDANAVGARPTDKGAPAAWASARRRFIPHVKSAAQQGIPFILRLGSGAKVGGGPSGGMDEARMYDLLAKTASGDLAWDGRFLATRGARLFSVRQEAARPLKYSDARHGAYELPEDVRLPYTLIACDREGARYLIKVFQILPEGVDIFYRALAPQEAAAYLPVKEKATGTEDEGTRLNGESGSKG